MTISSAVFHTPATQLLTVRDPPPYQIERPQGHSPFLLICDHAGQRIPARLADLGLPQAELQRHIAWDLGAAGLASQLAERLDAWLIRQIYSRLVVDCNRPPGVPGSMPVLSERTEIPANRELAAAARRARLDEIFWPYHRRITAELDRRRDEHRETLLISLHSFTPIYLGQARAWHMGVLYGRDPRLAHALRDAMRDDGRWQVGDNEPYAVSDSTDYAVPVHGEQRGLAHVAIELRQDLLADEQAQAVWAERLAGWLLQSRETLKA